MKTNHVKKDAKSLKKQTAPAEAMVMHTKGGEMPEVRKGHNSELKDAKSLFEKKETTRK